MEYEKLTFNFFADEIETLEKKIRSAARSFMNLIIESKHEEINTLYKTIKYTRNSGQAYIQELKIDEEIRNKIFDIGYNAALLDSMQLYLEKISAQKEIDRIKTKYKNEILLVLMEKRIMFHKDLAGELGVSASGLNAIIKQMNASSVKLINVDKISKFTLYSLTPVAYQYCIKLNKEKVQVKKENKKQFMLKEVHTNKKVPFNIRPANVNWSVMNVSDYEYSMPYVTTICRSENFINKYMQAGEPEQFLMLTLKAKGGVYGRWPYEKQYSIIK